MKQDFQDWPNIPNPTEWILKYLGPPKPDKYGDCWELVHYIYKNELGIELPLFPGVDWDDTFQVAKTFLKEVVSFKWCEISDPSPWCIVAMSTNSRLHHAGIWLPFEKGSVLHLSGHTEVLVDTLDSLKKKKFSTIKFYTYLNGQNHNHKQSV